MSIKRVKMIRKQLKQYIKKYKPVWKRCESDIVLKCLAKGLYYNSAFLHTDNLHYRTYKSRELVYIHPTSVLFQNRHKPQSIIFSEIIATTKKYVRNVSEADPIYLETLMKSNA